MAPRMAHRTARMISTIIPIGIILSRTATTAAAAAVGQGHDVSCLHDANCFHDARPPSRRQLPLLPVEMSRDDVASDERRRQLSPLIDNRTGWNARVVLEILRLALKHERRHQAAVDRTRKLVKPVVGETGSSLLSRNGLSSKEYRHMNSSKTVFFCSTKVM